jgi:hypothetical protein
MPGTLAEYYSAYKKEPATCSPETPSITPGYYPSEKRQNKNV